METKGVDKNDDDDLFFVCQSCPMKQPRDYLSSIYPKLQTIPKWCVNGSIAVFLNRKRNHTDSYQHQTKKFPHSKSVNKRKRRAPSLLFKSQRLTNKHAQSSIAMYSIVSINNYSNKQRKARNGVFVLLNN
jgi:hypothetical protein